MEKFYIKRYTYNENDNLGGREENGADKDLISWMQSMLEGDKAWEKERSRKR